MHSTLFYDKPYNVILQSPQKSTKREEFAMMLAKSKLYIITILKL